MRQGHPHSHEPPAQGEHCREQRRAQLRFGRERCKKPRAHRSDTTEESKEKPQSQWLGLARWANCAKLKATSLGNRAGRLTGQGCAKAGQEQLTAVGGSSLGNSRTETAAAVSGLAWVTAEQRQLQLCVCWG